MAAPALCSMAALSATMFDDLPLPLVAECTPLEAGLATRGFAGAGFAVLAACDALVPLRLSVALLPIRSGRASERSAVATFKTGSSPALANGEGSSATWPLFASL